MGAGVVTVFVKNDRTTTPAASGPAPQLSVSVPASLSPTAAPTTSVQGSRQLAARNRVKKQQDDVARVPILPASGIGGHPIGFVLLAFGAALALWVRRAARA